MSGATSRRKGATGEREVRDILNSYTLPNGEPVQAKRGCQHSGGHDSPDVAHNIPNLHLEVKRVEVASMSPAKMRDALAQSKRDAGEENLPVVCWRSNRSEWVAMLSFSDLLNLFGCEVSNKQKEEENE